jgi:GNAT superfamily N-acetyltransferase
MKNTITKPSNDEVKFLDEKIIEFNFSKVPQTDENIFIEINFVLKDENDKILGGIVGQKYYWNTAYIDVLWVDAAVRGKGIGTQLINKFEETALELNCLMIHLDTFDFQAPAFYKKLGYTLYGTLNDNPAGHKRFYFSKLLA